MYTLYKHQEKQNKLLRKSLRKTSHILYGAATGYGKSVALWDMIGRNLDDGLKVLVLAPRRALVFQLEKTFVKFEPLVMMGGIVRGHNKSRLILSSIQTTNSKLKNGSVMYNDIDIIYIDESHIGCNFPPKPNTLFDRLYLKYWDACKWVGLTATPITAEGHRLNGWDKTIYKYQTGDLIDMGFLADYEYKAPSSMDTSKFRVNKATNEYDVHDIEDAVLDTTSLNSIKKQLIKHYKSDTKAIIFCITIAHAEVLEREIRRDDVSVIHSKMSDAQTIHTLERFKAQKRGVLINVAMLTTGFDDPTINLLIIARPIRSVRLAMQVWGRGLRKHGKKVCLILDMCSVHETCGLPDDHRDFNKVKPVQVEMDEVLEEVEPDEVEGRMCEKCDAISPASEWAKRYKLIVKKKFDLLRWYCPECKHMTEDIKETRTVKTLVVIRSKKKRLGAMSKLSKNVKVRPYSYRKPLVFELVEDNTNAKPAMSHYICSDINKAKRGKMLDYILINYKKKILTSKEAWKEVDLIWQDAKENLKTS